jgi:XRE family aerobic/anaerobic benzoate catabolism transcriptional regulator
VRDLRQAQGLTLRALAKKASVSERFLVQLEAGEWNISVARLEDVAEALRTTGAALLARAGRPPVTAPPPRVVALVGLRGAGKSSIGAALASRIGVPFVELDEAIAREAQMTLSTIFEIHGEAYFRAMERDVLGRILAANEPVVLAAGGSIVTDAATWRLLRERALTVWLKAKPRDHWDRVVAQGDVRPMRGRPRAMNELRQLLAARTPLYEEAALTVDTSALPPAEVVNRIAIRTSPVLPARPPRS